MLRRLVGSEKFIRDSVHPGAMRVRGMCLDDEEEFQSSSSESTEVAEIQTSAVSLATEDPIQAMLVEDQEELKERELEEREARIKQSELEVDLKMQPGM